MEEFKKLNWGWEKYEEEKKQDQRVFSFETISDRDPLNRTLNEVHLCVLPKANEYRLFKTPQEIAANTFDKHGLKAELKDPRTRTTNILKSASEQVKSYGYSSELTQTEQLSIIRSLVKNSKHNKRIAKIQKALQIGNFKEPSADVKEKWKKEMTHFNKCAEIHYHRHIAELNNLISNDVKNFLLKRWNQLEGDLSEWKFQVITMLLRQKTWNKTAEMSLELDFEDSQEFLKHFYIVPNDFFPPIHRYSIERLNLYEQQKKLIDDSNESDVKISLDVLKKLFVDGDEFSITFENTENGTKFLSNEVVPSKLVNSVEALEVAVRKIFTTNIEWFNIDQKLQHDLNDKKNQSIAKVAQNPLLQVLQSCQAQNFVIEDAENFRARKTDELMMKVYTQYKCKGGYNTSTSKCKIKKNKQELMLSIQREVFYLDEDTAVDISFKIEFQTKFGAEKMTKEELLKEWIVQKLSQNSITLRYRVDAKTLQILSITQITLEEIEKDLKEIYEFNPLDALELLYNTLNTFKNLPHGNYLVQAKIGTLHIYKETILGKTIITSEDIKINSTFTRKWMSIDEKFPTYIHLNLKIAPCCFPISFGYKKRATTYKLPQRPAIVKKPIVAIKTKKKMPKRKIKKPKKFGD